MADSCYSTAETKATLWNNYTLIKEEKSEFIAPKVSKVCGEGHQDLGSHVEGVSNPYGASLQLLFCCSDVSESATPWTAALQASLSITISQSLLKLMSIKSVMPCNHLILCCPLVLLHSIPPETCCKLAFQLQSIIFYKVIKDKESTILNYDIYQKSKI